jgi:hypothetical protein
LTWSSTIALWFVVAGGVRALAQLADLGRQLRDEAVIGGLLDVDPLDRHADLTGVHHSAPGRGVGRAVEIGVGEDDHRVLAAELEADRGQRLGGASHHLAAGPVGAGELDEVDVVDQGAAGLTDSLHAVEHVGAADLVLPGVDYLGQAERGELGGLDDDGGAGLEGRDRVPDREDQGEVPGADDADDRVRPVLDPELLRGQQRRVGADGVLADELRGLRPVEVDDVGQVNRLVGGVGPDLAGLALHRVEDPLLVVEDPVAQLAEPVGAAFDAHRLPVGLVGANPGDGRGNLVRRGDRHRLNQLAGCRVEDVDLLGLGAAAVVGAAVGPGDLLRRTALHWNAPSSRPVWLLSQL